LSEREALCAVDQGFDGGGGSDDFGAGYQVGVGDVTRFGAGAANPDAAASVDEVALQLAERLKTASLQTVCVASEARSTPSLPCVLLTKIFPNVFSPFLSSGV